MAATAAIVSRSNIARAKRCLEETVVAADRKKQLLEENLNRVSSKLLARTDEVWTQAERKDMVRRFADSLCTCAEAMSTPEATCIDILGKLKLDFFDDEWFQGKFLRHLLEKVISEGNRDKEAEIQAEEDIMMYPVKPPEFLKHLFFALHTLEEEHQKAKGRHVISQRQYEQLSDSAHRKKAKDQEALTKVVAKTMEKHKTRNFVLARRNQVNRLRTGAKAKVLREEEKHLPEPPRAKSRLTIFEKLEVVSLLRNSCRTEKFFSPKEDSFKSCPSEKAIQERCQHSGQVQIAFWREVGRNKSMQFDPEGS